VLKFVEPRCLWMSLTTKFTLKHRLQHCGAMFVITLNFEVMLLMVVIDICKPYMVVATMIISTHNFCADLKSDSSNLSPTLPCHSLLSFSI
jgi:hypothetical protein